MVIFARSKFFIMRFKLFLLPVVLIVALQPIVAQQPPSHQKAFCSTARHYGV